MSVEKFLNQLESDFNNPEHKAELLETLKRDISKKTNILKAVCLDTLISNLNKKEERQKLIEQFKLSSGLEKAKSLFLNPFISTQVHIGLGGKDLVKSETTTTSTDKQYNTQTTTEEKQVEKHADKAEKLLLNFEKTLQDTKKRKKLLEQLEEQVDNLIPSIVDQCKTSIEQFFADENKKKELVDYLKKDPLIAKAEYLTFDPVVSLYYQYMYSLQD